VRRFNLTASRECENVIQLSVLITFGNAFKKEAEPAANPGNSIVQQVPPRIPADFQQVVLPQRDFSAGILVKQF
jgi:hypothetical protein